ncbi:hypothetical protein DDI_3503 [Dickeya dianthicola RNS04.9]|nr:hypothetical protein DDI_3503 [Dickeya dianthicola RNS04.9]
MWCDHVRCDHASVTAQEIRPHNSASKTPAIASRATAEKA